MNIKLPEPLQTMLKRYDYIERNEPKNYVKPQDRPGNYLPEGQIQAAAEAVASWDLSDPFAYGRTALHARQGYLDAKKTAEDFHLRTVSRRTARVREVEKMLAQLRSDGAV